MPQFICRLCDNNAGWVRPTNSATEIRLSHFGNFGFGYEEWNFNSNLLLAGWQYGWIEGFKPGPGRRLVAPGAHEVLLYVRRNGQAFAVGRLLMCEKLTSSTTTPSYPPLLAGHANAIGAAITTAGTTWNVTPVVTRPKMPAYSQIPYANVRFRPKDAALLANPVPIPIVYTRYGALLVTPANGLTAIWNIVP